MKHKLFYIFSLLLTCLFITGCAEEITEQAAPQPSVQREEIVPRPPISDSIKKVTLFLPLQGGFAEQSQAIKNGFLAAYYNGQKSGQKFSMQIVDTTNQDAGFLYEQETTKGTDIIIGPLTKAEVSRIAAMPELSVPVIALNTLDASGNYREKPKVNFYQFGLPTAHEISEAARKISQDGHNNIAVIYPTATWAAALAAEFKRKAASLGKTIIAEMPYSNADNPTTFAPQVRRLMGIDEEQFAIANKGRQHNAEVQHRTDVDAIFIIAYPKQARQIVPLLKFYYANEIPIYSVSLIYSGVPEPGADQDIDGVTFCDMPWVTNNPASFPQYLQDIQGTVVAMWQQSFNKYSKLYALGIDAYSLATSFNKLIANPMAGIAGATGGLYLNNQNQIYRKLSWTTMQQGKPQNL